MIVVRRERARHDAARHRPWRLGRLARSASARWRRGRPGCGGRGGQLLPVEAAGSVAMEALRRSPPLRRRVCRPSGDGLAAGGAPRFPRRATCGAPDERWKTGCGHLRRHVGQARLRLPPGLAEPLTRRRLRRPLLMASKRFRRFRLHTCRQPAMRLTWRVTWQVVQLRRLLRPRRPRWPLMGHGSRTPPATGAGVMAKTGNVIGIGVNETGLRRIEALFNMLMKLLMRRGGRGGWSPTRRATPASTPTTSIARGWRHPPRRRSPNARPSSWRCGGARRGG